MKLIAIQVLAAFVCLFPFSAKATDFQCMAKYSEGLITSKYDLDTPFIEEVTEQQVDGGLVVVGTKILLSRDSICGVSMDVNSTCKLEKTVKEIPGRGEVTSLAAKCPGGMSLDLRFMDLGSASTRTVKLICQTPSGKLDFSRLNCEKHQN